MAYMIQYSGFCIQGLVRKNNEDNIFCEDRYLPIVHTDDVAGFSGIFSRGEPKQFAVFDGMGGEACGEIASYYAARTFASEADYVRERYYRECTDDGTAVTEDLRTRSFEYRAKITSKAMNRVILDYAFKNRIRSMGSTVASLFFSQDAIQGFNIGDSRCYRLSENSLAQLSMDHVIAKNSIYAGYLTQCLGISKREQTLEPALYYSDYSEGDIFLLCTDGLTKLVSERRIESVLKKKKSVDEKAGELKDVVLKKGAVDNTTILVFEIAKQKRKWFSGLLRGCLTWAAG